MKPQLKKAELTAFRLAVAILEKEPKCRTAAAKLRAILRAEEMRREIPRSRNHRAA